MIHKTFSKQELKDIIIDLNLNIQNLEYLNKHELINSIDYYLENDFEINFESSDFFKNKNIDDVKKYLSNPNPNKILSVKERNDILKLCKEIIHYCKNGFLIENTIFLSLDEIIIHMNHIKQFGDIPSVRRCCKLIKGDLKIHETFEPNISLKMQKDLEIKRMNKMKNKKVNNLIIKYGTFLIEF